MSKIPYLIAFVVSLSFVSCENDITTSEVPSIVENTFKSKFVQAKNVEWEFANDTYEASFDVENVDHDALLDSSGNLLKHKRRIDGTAVPQGIRAFLAQNHLPRPAGHAAGDAAQGAVGFLGCLGLGHTGSSRYGGQK